jgi:hypothetical protein
LLNQLTDLHSLQGDVDAALAALAYMERVSGRLRTADDEQQAFK